MAEKPKTTAELKKIHPLEHFRQRPSMYIGKPSLYGLECFISGAELSESVSADSLPLFDVDWLEFDKWVIKTKTKRKNVRKSFDLARQMCNNDEAEAFYLWMDWFKEYKEKKDERNNREDEKSLP